MSGFFIIRASAVDAKELDPAGFKILLEILAREKIDKIAEVPHTSRERECGESKLTANEYVKYAEHMVQLGLISRGFETCTPEIHAFWGR